MGRYRIPLTVAEPSGMARTANPVTSGVPVPEGALADAAACRLLDGAGMELPLQTQALVKWPDGSVKWLLLDFQVDLDPGASCGLTLELGPGVTSAARHSTPVSVRPVEGGVEIETANSRFPVSISALPHRIEAVFTARSAEGSRDGLYTARVEDLRVEESGPLRAVVRAAGWHYRADGRKRMPFVMRFSAWAGLPVLGVQHTFIVSDDPLTTFFRGIGLRIPLRGQLRETPDGVALLNSGEGALGVLVRDRERLLPKENHYDTEAHALGVYLWPLHGEEMDLRSVLVRQPPDFQEWKGKYPELFERLEGGPMTPQEALDFYTGRRPVAAMGDWRARTGKGASRTHDIFIASASESRCCERTLRPFGRPLFAVCPPAYYARTAALGHFHPRDTANFPEIERAIETHLEWLRRHRDEWAKWWGFWDYGDYLSNYDAKRGEWWKYDDGMRGWNNGEVNTDHGPFLQFLRTGERRYLDFAEAMARHRMDCDQCHFEDDHPAFVGGVHRHHLTEHWTGLIDGGHLWVDGMVNLYCLFGLRRALECAVEGAAYAARYGVAYAVRRADTCRETNNCLRTLARVYEATGDPQWGEAAEAMARAYLCSFAVDGAEIPLNESLALLQREFAGSRWERLPEILEYNWGGHTGYGYIGYLAPAVQYAAALVRAPATVELARRLDQFSGSLLGDAGQFFGDRYIETGEAKYVIALVRNLAQSITVLAPTDGRGDRPDSYGDGRRDYLYGVPYVLAALYGARNVLERLAAKPSSDVKGHRAPAAVTGGARGRFVCLDLSAAANADPRRNPFGRKLKDAEARALPALAPGQIGFQAYRGDQAIRDGYVPVSAHQMYPSTRFMATPNHYAMSGLPLGGRVAWGGVPYQFVNPEANRGKAVVALDARRSVTIPVGWRGRSLRVLGHVHGRRESRRLSQFSEVPVGWYDLKYADGRTDTIELVNGIHFDSAFSQACARAVEHVANFDWLHVWANLTDDRTHLNAMTLPLRAEAALESLTFRSADEDWGLLLAALTLEGLEDGTTPDAPWRDVVPVAWHDLPGWLDVKRRRVPDGAGLKLFAPARGTAPMADGWYEVELTVSGDPEGCPRLRVENLGRQVLADYCLAGQGGREAVRFLAEARDSLLTLDLIPGQNYATGSLFPAKGYVGSYGAWWSPNGNFTRVESLRARTLDPDRRVELPAAAHYGWLLPGASSEAVLGGLVVDHEDADEGSPTTMKWRAGGFRADLPNGRYKIILHHSTYAKMGTVFVDIFANGRKVIGEREVDEEAVEFEAQATGGFIELTWRQPRTHCRVPRYSIQHIIFERICPE